jgi:phage gp36-like protein
MAYATIAEFESWLTTAQLSGYFTETGTAKTAAETAILDRSSSHIDSYLCRRAVVPVTTTAYLAKLCLVISAWEVASTRTSWTDVPARIRQQYDDALAELEAIADGTKDWGATITPASSSGGLAISTSTAVLDGESFEDASW